LRQGRLLLRPGRYIHYTALASGENAGIGNYLSLPKEQLLGGHKDPPNSHLCSNNKVIIVLMPEQPGNTARESGRA
jgi:hypothetical protein